MDYTTANINSVAPSFNQFTATKRKLDLSDKKEKSSKRTQFDHSPTSNLLLLQNMPSITYASPDYKPTFRISSNATANMANTPPPIIEDTVMEDEYTDEDEILQTPSSMSCSEFIPQEIGQDLDQGGYTGSLELGWSEMYSI